MPWITQRRPYRNRRPSKIPYPCDYEALRRHNYSPHLVRLGVDSEHGYNNQGPATHELPHLLWPLPSPPESEIDASNYHNKASSPQCGSVGSLPQTPTPYKGHRSHATANPVYLHHTTPTTVAPTWGYSSLS